MPLQCGPLLITGTIDNVCFYRMDGQYYARMKSSLTRKRVLKDPKFQLTRVHAALLGEASKIASRVYRLITGEQKKHALYREITGKAIYLLRGGKEKEEVFDILCGQYLKPEPVAPELQVIRPGDHYYPISLPRLDSANNEKTTSKKAVIYWDAVKFNKVNGSRESFLLKAKSSFVQHKI